MKVSGWKTVTNTSNYTIYSNGDFARVDFHHASNATLPRTYDYTIPTGYYPKYNIGTISSTLDSNGVHYAVFTATTQGDLKMMLHKPTYNNSTNGVTVYGMLLYPI